jgi:hypothetical protein
MCRICNSMVEDSGFISPCPVFLGWRNAAHGSGIGSLLSVLVPRLFPEETSKTTACVRDQLRKQASRRIEKYVKV